MSDHEPNSLSQDEAEFETELQELEESLEALKSRFLEFKRQHRDASALEERIQAVEGEWHAKHLPELEKELNTLKTQLQEAQVNLESALLSNNELKQLFFEALKQGLIGEVFWQIVRFGGLGILLGWMLKSWGG